MRTAIFVYQTTAIKIHTCEADLELSGMNTSTVSLSSGDNERTLAPGIYKIISSQVVSLIGDTSAFDVVVTTHNKDNDPTLPPSRATVNLAPLDTAALHNFMAVEEAKDLVNP